MPYQSPKRQRKDDPYVPKLQPVHLTDLSSADTADMSPRTSMAGRFRDLQIQHSKHSDAANFSQRIIQFNDTIEPSISEMEVLESETTSHPQDSTINTPTTNTTINTTSSAPFSPSPPLSPSKKRRKRSISPPPSDPASEFFWSDAEITGHNPSPDDPDDDMTGINGIGFKPTAAIAYARSQRRKQQVMEWRRREAAEARGRRSERRKAHDGGGSGSGGEVDGDGIGVGDGGRKVRFDES